MARIRLRSFTSGWPNGLGFMCTSHRPMGSWLNMVERWFAELTTKQIRRGSHRSVPELERAIREFIDANNAEPKPFVWTKSADEILASIARFAQRTFDTHTS